MLERGARSYLRSRVFPRLGAALFMVACSDGHASGPDDAAVVDGSALRDAGSSDAGSGAGDAGVLQPVVWGQGTLVPGVGGRYFGARIAATADGRRLVVTQGAADSRADAYVLDRSDQKWGLPQKLPRAMGLNFASGFAAISASGDTVALGFSDALVDFGGSAVAYTYFAGTFGGPEVLTRPAGAKTFGFVALCRTGSRGFVGDPGANRAVAYNYAGGSWTAPLPLETPDGAQGFGSDASFSSDCMRLFVGSSGGPGYVFDFVFGFWKLTAIITSPRKALHAEHGVLSEDGMTLVVSHPGGGPDLKGSVDRYRYQEGSWSSEGSLAAPPSSSTFGSAIAMTPNGDRIVVGDPNGGPDEHGTVVVFDRGLDGTWRPQPLARPDSAATFGKSVAITDSGRRLFVSAFGDSANEVPGGLYEFDGVPQAGLSAP